MPVRTCTVSFSGHDGIRHSVNVQAETLYEAVVLAIRAFRENDCAPDSASQTVEHGGGTFGYRTELLRFPEQRFSVVALCNVANADVEGFARRISDLYLEKQLTSEVRATTKSAAFPDPAVFAGTYLDPRAHMIYTFTAGEGNLMAWGSKLERLGANEFSDLVGNPIVFKSANRSMTATLTLQGETYFSGDRIAPLQLNEAALKGFTGNYHSDELEATYELSLVKGALTLKIGSQPRVNLEPIAADKFQAGDLGMIVFNAAIDHRISGLTLFSQPARGITFVRTGRQ